MLLPSTRRAASNEFRLVLNCGVRTQSIASRLPSSSINGVYQRSAICYPSSLSTKSRMNFSTTPLTRQEEQQEEEKEMDDGEKNIHDILTRTFEPKMLKVSDVSGGCGSFYAIVIASSHFNGKPTVSAHRLVNEALKEVIAGIHGLQLRTMPVKN